MAGLERLKIQFNVVDAKKIFHYMDSDFNGEVSFNEFCELSEEKRRNLY
jgi:hypothetical protein